MGANQTSNKRADENLGVQSGELLIKFKGMDADQQRLPLDDFLASLTGWRDYLNVASSSFLQRKLTLIQPSEGGRLDIRIRQVRPGSQEVLVVVCWCCTWWLPCHQG